MKQTCVIYWFRRDLRLDDNPALCLAMAKARDLGVGVLPVVVKRRHTVDSLYGEIERNTHAQAWADDAEGALAASLRERGSDLWRCESIDALRALMRSTQASHLYAEHIELPYEREAQGSLSRDATWQTHFIWQSGLFDQDLLPFSLNALPKVFTAFREKIEKASLRSIAPLPEPKSLVPTPLFAENSVIARVTDSSAFKPSTPGSIAHGRRSGEQAARQHWQAYLDRGLPHRYFETRNQLSGPDFSSQLSLDLAWGTLSVRRAAQMLDAFEASDGRTKSSYWLWFEWMWREHFRWISHAYGRQIFAARGLSESAPKPTATVNDWQRWTGGTTGHAFIDAGMHELATTGFLSNRMRQIVASYWLNDLGGDWRAGAAWFESQLIDDDAYSNTGNWLYIAGLGTDPRGGRRFDPDKQAKTHDPQGHYRRLWA